MRINTNLPAINAYRHYITNKKLLDRDSERLSSGHRTNRAKDDIAGLSISENMRTQINALIIDEQNIQDAISMLHVAEAGMEATDEKLLELRQLAVQAATETYTAQDREKLQLEVDQLLAEIDRIASSVKLGYATFLELIL